MFPDHTLLVVLLLAGFASGIVVSLALGALAQRRSVTYFLVTLAFVVFASRTVLAFLSVGHVVTGHTHHLLEHAMDVVTVGLLLGAVYVTRSSRTLPSEATHD